VPGHRLARLEAQPPHSCGTALEKDVFAHRPADYGSGSRHSRR
jgi:hypothetical protein